MVATRTLGSLKAKFVLLALGGIFGGPCSANSNLDRPSISFKYLIYKDSQPGAERIKVSAPSIGINLPLGEDWSFSSSAVVDTISGASPRYHSEIQSLSEMHDVRRASQFDITTYKDNYSAGFGAAFSKESDYSSRVLSLQASRSSEDKNSTLNVGLSQSRDTINPANQVVSNERKRVNEALVGFTQVISPYDIAQVNYAYSSGSGYFSDPYKFFDNRPRSKVTRAWLVRWNHHFTDLDMSSRLSYRYYKDSYGIKSHTISSEIIKPLSSGWIVSPSIRFYSQTSAYFYVPVVAPPDPTLPDGFIPGVTFLTLDQRMSAFGGISWAIKIEKYIGNDWRTDFKYERYSQNSKWASNTASAVGMAPFNADIYHFGITRFF